MAAIPKDSDTSNSKPILGGTDKPCNSCGEPSTIVTTTPRQELRVEDEEEKLTKQVFLHLWNPFTFPLNPLIFYLWKYLIHGDSEDDHLFKYLAYSDSDDEDESNGSRLHLDPISEHSSNSESTPSSSSVSSCNTLMYVHMQKSFFRHC